MEFKFSVLFGIVLAIIVLGVANGVYMVDPTYVDAAAIIMVIVFTLIFTKLYIGKVSVTLGGMIAVSIVWLIVVAIIEAIVVFAMNFDLTTYYSNYMIYVGYILIVILAIVGYKIFARGGAAPSTPAAPAEKPAAPSATPTA
ncbi:MAG: hypothetical protein GTN76_14675 [Candidatus Aenigmarchaeota archaeon]|nr:hypothetical protein [Candidatus Aenigmarchaeota archaeon]